MCVCVCYVRCSFFGFYASFIYAMYSICVGLCCSLYLVFARKTL